VMTPISRGVHVLCRILVPRVHRVQKVIRPLVRYHVHLVLLDTINLARMRHHVHLVLLELMLPLVRNHVHLVLLELMHLARVRHNVHLVLLELLGLGPKGRKNVNLVLLEPGGMVVLHLVHLVLLEPVVQVLQLVHLVLLKLMLPLVRQNVHLGGNVPLELVKRKKAAQYQI
jgi:hypothetical protein